MQEAIGAVTRARAWLAHDPDPETGLELRDLIGRVCEEDAEALADVEARFAGRLSFGTAGLRGRMGAGSARMNRVVVAQAAAGLGNFLRERVVPTRQPLVVIGFDARRNSRVFAEESARVLAGQSVRVVVLPRPLPTPVLAFAVRALEADAGVMVTASHNPAQDNGYKVFLGGVDGGSQVISPADGEIMDQINAVAEDSRMPQLPRADTFTIAGEELVDAYVRAAAAVAPAGPSAAGLRWVYSAMHGVGWETLDRVVTAAGFPAPTLVGTQRDPDPDFPTLPFPNPEEPGALDRAFEVAREHDAELVLATDPDADRLGVAIPDRKAVSGWRTLTGNEVGLLLAWQAARAAQGTPGASLACSLVSTPALEIVARRYGVAFHATLPGSKWISRAPGLVFGFEESLGYLMHPQVVRDKDGIAAATAVLHLADTLRTEGRTIGDMLDAFDREFGYFGSGQITIRTDDRALVDNQMSLLRLATPDRIGPFAVTGCDDLRDNLEAGAGCDALRYQLQDGGRVIIRPSGTEPLLKIYLDTRGDSRSQAEARLAVLRSGAQQLLKGTLHA